MAVGYVSTIASLFGGIAAVIYLNDYFSLKANERRRQASGSGLQFHADSVLWKALIVGVLPMRTFLASQWTIAALIVTMSDRRMGVFAILVPFWTVPLAYFVVRAMPRRSGVAAFAAGLAGAMMGVVVQHVLLGWSSIHGLTIGIFFGSMMAAHIAVPRREIGLLAALSATALLLYGLHVFREPGLYAEQLSDPPVLPFLVAGTAALISLIVEWGLRVPNSARGRRSKLP